MSAYEFTREPDPISFRGFWSKAFDLRGRGIAIQQAEVFASSLWDIPPVGSITDKEVVVYGVVIAKRSRDAAAKHEPYAYITDDPDSAKGIWLHQATYTLIETAPAVLS